MTGQAEGLLAAPPVRAERADDLRPLDLAEQAMLVGVRNGERRAMRAFYDTYRDQVRAHLFRMLGSDSELDDVMQMVFARAFTALPGFRGGSGLSTWLYRITANTTRSLLRSRYRRERLWSAFSWFSGGQRSYRHEARLGARDEARWLLQRLHPELREVFVLYHHEGLTLQEISEILQKSVSTVGDRLARARERLHRLARRLE